MYYFIYREWGTLMHWDIWFQSFNGLPYLVEQILALEWTDIDFVDHMCIVFHFYGDMYKQ